MKPKDQTIQTVEPKTPVELVLIENKRADFNTLAELSKTFKIKDINDKEGYEALSRQKTKLVTARTSLKEERLNYTRHFDKLKENAITLENDLLAILAPAEEMLEAEKSRIDKEKTEIKEKALREAKEKLDARNAKLQSVGFTMGLFDLELLTDDEFALLLATETARDEAKQKADEEEAERIRQQDLKLEEERREFAIAQGKLLEDQAKLDADRKAIDDAKAKIETDKKAAEDAEIRKAELEKAQKESAEKARIETEERIKREALEAKQKADAEQAELEKKKKFQKFLADNGVTKENFETEFKLVSLENGTKALYRKVGIYV